MDFDLLNMLYSMFFWFWWNFQSNIAQESSTQKPNQFLRGMSYEFNTQNNAAPCMLKPHFHYSNVSRKNCLIIFHAWSQQNQSKNLSSLQTEAFQPTRIYAAIQEGQRSQHVKIVAWHPSSLIYNACQYPEQLLNTDSRWTPAALAQCIQLATVHHLWEIKVSNKSSTRGRGTWHDY